MKIITETLALEELKHMAVATFRKYRVMILLNMIL